MLALGLDAQDGLQTSAALTIKKENSQTSQMRKVKVEGFVSLSQIVVRLRVNWQQLSQAALPVGMP
jgi:hypothetical protein